MPGQTRRSSRTTHKKAKKPKKITFHEFLRSLPRPYPDPHIEWHIRLYDALTTLKRQLEKLTHKPLLSNDDLVKLGVVRGAEFVIDEDNPIDLEPRFFNPGSSHVVAYGVQNYEESEWPSLYPGHENPINSYGYPGPNIDDIWEFVGACWGLVDWERRFSTRENRITWQKNPNWDSSFVTAKTNFYRFKQDWIHQHNFHQFQRGRWLMSRPFSRGCRPGPEVSHTMVIVADTVVPDKRLLRSELLMAAMLLRDNLAQQFWPAHYTFPVLMFSFYHKGCRLLQIHPVNGRLHIRASRPLDITSHDKKVPADAKLVARWMLAETIGNTRFSAMTYRNLWADEQRGPQHPGASWALALSS